MADSTVQKPSSNPPSVNLSAETGRPGAVILALIVGFTGIIFISFFTHWYEVVIFQNTNASISQVIVNALTPIVFFLTFLLVAVLNPILHRLLPSLVLSRRELIIIMSLWLVTGVICFTNLGTPVLGTIGVLNSQAAERDMMRKVSIKSYLRSDLFLRPEEANEYYAGKSDHSSRISPLPRSPLLRASDLKDSVGLASRLRAAADPLSAHLAGQITPEERQALEEYMSSSPALRQALIEELNRIIRTPGFFDGGLFKRLGMSERKGEPSDLLNRALLEEAYPQEILRGSSAGRVLLDASDIKGPASLAGKLQKGKDPVSRRLREGLLPSTRGALEKHARALRILEDSLVAGLNRAVEGPCLYERDRFAKVTLIGEVLKLINRLLLEAAYPQEIRRAPMPVPWAFRVEDLKDAPALAARLRSGQDAASQYVRQKLSADTLPLLDKCLQAADNLAVLPEKASVTRAQVEASAALEKALVGDLNRLLKGPCLFEEARFAGVALTEKTRALPQQKPQGQGLLGLNRVLLEEAWPAEVTARARAGSPLFRAGDFRDLPALGLKLQKGADPLSQYLYAQFSPVTRESVERYSKLSELLQMSQALEQSLVGGMNAAQQGPCLWDTPAFGQVKLSARHQTLVNRLLLEQAYKAEIAGLPPSVPWAVWWQPLSFWVPLMLVVVILSASLVRMVHRQWSKHELLAYPLADVTDSILRRSEGRAFPEAFYDKVFWIGFGLICFMYTVNGLNVWFPSMIKIPMGFQHTELIKEFPFLSKYCGGEAYAFFRGWAYPFIVCISVLLPTEISLTCWLGWSLMVLGTGAYYFLTKEVITGTETSHIQHGMYFAMVAVILIIGRREYLNVLRCAIGLRRTEDEALRGAARGCRVFLVAFAAFTLLLVYAGLDWVLALALVFSFSLVALLLARMTAEVGDPWLVNFGGVASGVPLRLLGTAALGPKGLAVSAVLNTTLDSETTNSIAAQETTVQKVREKESGWLARAGFNLILALGLCVAVCATTFFTLWDNYSFGAGQERNTWSSSQLDTASSAVNRLQIEGTLEKLKGVRGLERLSYVKVDWKFWRFFLYGAGVVAACAVLRLRFAWWPFHPLPLLFINTWAMSRLFFAFSLGWLIKVALLKIWGGKVFARSKPFFIGVIAGQVVMAGVWISVAAVYYLVTHAVPKSVAVFI